MKATVDYLRALTEILEATYHRAAHYEQDPPLSAEPSTPLGILMVTILSQASNDVQTRKVYRALRERFGEWSEVARAPRADVQAVLKPGGLSQQKAKYLQAALADIYQRTGAYDLDFLRDRSDASVREFLTGLFGVGLKTAACVELFGLGRAAFPVDTHVSRIAKRLGLVSPTASPEKVQRALEPVVPDDLALALHLNLLAHGREVCTARVAHCDRCVLLSHCEQVGV